MSDVPAASKAYPKKKRKIHGGGESVPTVEMSQLLYRAENLSQKDVDDAAKQLGYVTFNIVDVAARDQEGLPTVLQLYPLNRNELKGRYSGENGEALPFPTMMWLACPTLQYRISVLEHDQWIVKLYERLTKSEKSAEYLQAMQRAHKQYGAERWGLLTETDKAKVEQRKGWVAALRDVGVAGMRDFGAVKCLHCHYAHYAARPEHGNVIGQWVHELLLDEDREKEKGVYCSEAVIKTGDATDKTVTGSSAKKLASAPPPAVLS